MDVSGINNKLNSNTIYDAKNKITDDSFEKRLKSALDTQNEKELKNACQEFEGMLLNMMYKQMKATVPKWDVVEEDPGMEIFDSMLDDQLVEEASKTGRLGLGDMLYKQLSQQMKSTYRLDDGNDKG
ncbi:MAG: rod-binding protein [Clostridiales bacterium]|jgi:flagellar protein FlgJ|nr:rod-binding protein [Eubacteriales bacterium]MDH7567024.1 rod-binding protein [Clostridiales bacterium]